MRSKNIAAGLSRRSALTLGAAAASALALGSAPAAAAKRGGVKITVLYGAPKSPDDFEKYYAEHHMPMVYKLKGVRRIELAKALATPGAAAPAYYRVTELWFSSMKKMQAVTATAEWQEIAADVPKFASGARRSSSARSADLPQGWGVPALARPNSPLLEPLAETRRERDGLSRAVVDQHHDAFRGGGAELAREHALAQAEGAAADGEHARADVDGAGIEELGAKIELEAHDDEVGVGREKLQALVIKEAHSPALAKGGEDGVVDMALPVGVAVAQPVGGPDAVGPALDRRRQAVASAHRGDRHPSGAGVIVAATTPSAMRRSISAAL
jgi:uncharacterized protein (TIGR02118 family)